jgi:hypothetical protein
MGVKVYRRTQGLDRLFVMNTDRKEAHMTLILNDRNKAESMSSLQTSKVSLNRTILKYLDACEYCVQSCIHFGRKSRANIHYHQHHRLFYGQKYRIFIKIFNEVQVSDSRMLLREKPYPDSKLRTQRYSNTRICGYYGCYA